MTEVITLVRCASTTKDARAAQHNRGILRVYTGRDDDRLLGAEMCAPAGEHVAHLLALALQQLLTVRELLRIVLLSSGAGTGIAHRTA